MTSLFRALFIPILLVFCGAVQSQVIYKCIAQGKTVYTESPCIDGDYQNNRFNVVDDRIGNATYDKKTIEDARSSIRAGIDERGVGVGTSSSLPIGASAARAATPETRQQQCLSIENKKKVLEARSRKPNSNYALDQIRAQQVQLKRDAYDWAC